MCFEQKFVYGEFIFKQSKIKDIKTDKQKVSIKIAETIKKFSINLRWLLTEKGDKLNENQIKYVNSFIEFEIYKGDKG